MKGDYVRLLPSKSPQRAIPKRDVAVRRPVKPVSPNAMPSVQVIGNGIPIRLLGNGMMESRVERRHLRHVGTQQFSRRQNSLYVIRIVQRRQVDAILNPLKHSI